MSEQRQPAHWTWDAYVAWQATQPNRHELVDGEVHAMGGGTAAHDRIANTLRFAPTARLPQGAACRLHGPDMMPRTGTGNARYPDALIDCGPCVPEALQAQEPVAVFEVLLRSTGWVDQRKKLRDYDATPGIRYYVLVSQDEPRIMVYVRNDNGRLDIRDAVLLEDPEATLDLPSIGISIPLSVIYHGVEFGRLQA